MRVVRLLLFVALAAALVFASDVEQRFGGFRGGGARPSFGRGSRPVQRPSFGGSRPSLGRGSRPSRTIGGNRPSRPVGGNRPSRRISGNRPSRRPSSRPSRRPTIAPTKPAATKPNGMPSNLTKTQQQAYKIIQYEGRFDKNGNLMVYKLPSGDGGGKYEVAGINDRYHPQAAAALKGMVERGEHQKAKEYASNYLQKYTDATAAKSKVPAIQFYLRDTSFNRGPGGAAKILQHALGVPVNGKMNDATMNALRNAEKNPQALLKKLRSSREWYERNYAHRDERSKFWKGLVNRWNNAERDAASFGFTPDQ
jgi:hypothetical protein